MDSPALLKKPVTHSSQLVAVVERGHVLHAAFALFEDGATRFVAECVAFSFGIHFALVDIDGELAKQAIIELSCLMRYLLYESEQTTVPLRRELTFVSHYLELMKIRFDESVALTYQKPEAASPILEAGIPPLLLLTFIENAFKHGISHKEPSFIDIRIAQENNQLHFYCANSNYNSDSMQPHQGGVGLDNVRKRLQLIYQDRYKLDIMPTRKVFTVDLWLPV